MRPTMESRKKAMASRGMPGRRSSRLPDAVLFPGTSGSIKKFAFGAVRQHKPLARPQCLRYG